MQDTEQRLEQPDEERQDKAPGRKEQEEAEGTDSALQASKPSRKLVFKPPGQETLDENRQKRGGETIPPGELYITNTIIS